MSDAVSSRDAEPVAKRKGEVVSFYSYKGGVGRSMALANVATLLTQARKKVLIIDFDFDAPGLHRYFPTPQPAASQAGMIDLAYELQHKLDQLATVFAGKPEAASRGERNRRHIELEAATRQVVADAIDSGRYMHSVHVMDPNRVTGGKPKQLALDLVPAGRFDSEYAERIRGFRWQEFYRAHPQSLRIFAEELAARFDFVLIDSRTGLTDIGSICTVLLPEKLVLVFTPNEQSLNGVTQVGFESVNARKASSDLRPLPLFPLLSRIENAEEELQKTWIDISRQRFEKVFRDAYSLPSCDLISYFDAVRIPHKSAYAYGEKIAAEHQRVTEQGSLAAAYFKFSEKLQCNNVVDADPERREQGQGTAEAEARAFDAELRAKQAEEKAKELEKRLARTSRNKRLAIAVGVLSLSGAGLGLIWHSQGPARALACMKRELAARGVESDRVTAIVDDLPVGNWGGPLYSALLEPEIRKALQGCDASISTSPTYGSINATDGVRSIEGATIGARVGDGGDTEFCTTDSKGSCTLFLRGIEPASVVLFDIEVGSKWFTASRAATMLTDPTVVVVSRSENDPRAEDAGMP